MRQAITWLIRIAVVVLLVKAGMWGYEQLPASGRQQPQQQVLDIDKACRIFADSGQCVCRHRRTNRVLDIPYDECVSLARD
jgi:hypothetical protein